MMKRLADLIQKEADSIKDKDRAQDVIQSLEGDAAAAETSEKISCEGADEPMPPSLPVEEPDGTN